MPPHETIEQGPITGHLKIDDSIVTKEGQAFAVKFDSTALDLLPALPCNEISGTILEELQRIRFEVHDLSYKVESLCYSSRPFAGNICSHVYPSP